MSAAAAMDLNASPEPEEEEDPFLKRRLEPRAESAVEIARRVPFDSLHFFLFFTMLLLLLLDDIYIVLVFGLNLGA